MLCYAELPKACLKSYPDCVEAIEAISNGTTIREDELMMIGDFPTEPGNPSAPRFYSTLRQYILEELVVDPLLSLLELRQEDNEDGMTVALLLASAQYKNNPKVRVGGAASGAWHFSLSGSFI